MLMYSPPKRIITIQGRREKPAKCERCGCHYSYELVCTGQGEDKSLFSWTDKQAYAKAAKNAEQDLENKLRHETAIAPCPNCGWVQEAMIHDMNAQSYLGLNTISTMAILVGLVIGGLFAAASCVIRPFSPGMLGFGLGVLAVGAITSAAFSALRNALLRWCDPNRHFERDDQTAMNDRPDPIIVNDRLQETE